MRTRPRKGLQDIPTRSSLTGETHNPQRKFLRVANLELKKALCQKVRDAALKRAAEMDRAIADLEGEKARILATVEASGEGQPHPISAPRPKRQPGADVGRDLTLKY